ncbi:hypothetical protein C8A00DRAFT_32290 [Chaetomidium leptoderma]|uniref:Uncharacterized protein n=1 Tax=Chaetomidium leptoderma TaxID=669021 RepID=A0AAN6VPJ2_9PEZI|nr:hypothetical protein C8A00DRAFT_32290 [Chaetomidium leptoderma]
MRLSTLLALAAASLASATALPEPQLESRQATCVEPCKPANYCCSDRNAISVCNAAGKWVPSANCGNLCCTPQGVWDRAWCVDCSLMY